MTELQLYKFIEGNDIEYNLFKDGATGEITKVIAFVPIFLIEEFTHLFKNSLILVDNPLECHLKEHDLCIELTKVCEYFDIEPENIFKKK